jgi:hypothetical protein
MSQFDLGTIDPNTKDGASLASDLTNWRSALHSSHKGSTAPGYAISGMLWVDDSADPTWNLKFYDGNDWIVINTIDISTNTANGQSNSSSGASGNSMQSINFNKVF